ncbi:MAG: MCE family protein [Candidatus Cloacimonetes bacterium]|nr:MCE family protein [Candidatus Cloacimonadota bacterium]
MKFYDKKRKIELTVGIFSVMALLILVFSYGWFKELFEKRDYVDLTVLFTNAANLEEGSPVSVLGVKKGRIKSIEINEQGVLLHLQVKLDFPLREDARFTIVETNLMGDVRVEIEPGSSPRLLDLGSVHSGSTSYSLSKLITQLTCLVSEFSSLLTQAQGKEGISHKLLHIIDQVDQLTSRLNDYFDEDIGAIVDNTLIITAQTKQLLHDNRENVTAVVDSVAMVLSGMDNTISKIDLLSQNLVEVSDLILDRQSTVGNLIRDRELYDNLLRVTARLDSLLLDIKENPTRYFKIKIL